MAQHLGEFEQLLLFALLRLGDHAYGMTLRRAIEDRTGRSVSAGAVYTTMERMEARGFVSSRFGEPTPQRGGRRKKHYRLEADGARALQRTYGLIREMAAGLDGKLADLAAAPEASSAE